MPTPGTEDAVATTKPSSVAEYIATKPDDVQPILERVRSAIRTALPDAAETISYAIPAYKVQGNTVIFFAGWKRHYSLYPATKSVIDALGDDLAPYDVNDKGTIRFPLSQPVPAALIARIAMLRAAEVAADGSTAT
jgi:uncharacterized protein YdhG (YjbR/CyaY superfamily)